MEHQGPWECVCEGKGLDQLAHETVEPGLSKSGRVEQAPAPWKSDAAILNLHGAFYNFLLIEN